MVAIDLGSNSFHMVIAKVRHGEIKIQSQLSEKVQLAAGLDEHNQLSPAAQTRALDCLTRFSERIQPIHAQQIRVVGTNALRKAKNANHFIQRAETLIGAPIEVIGGREEARLIYLGVSHSLESTPERRLVIDIGGGSTEFILGEGFEPILLESLHVGCVAYRERFFQDGTVTEPTFDQAVTSARSEIAAIEQQFKLMGWQAVAGSSGSVRIIERMLNEHDEGLISLAHLERLKQTIIKSKRVDQLTLPGLKPERRNIFPAGLAILTAVFQQLGIKRMRYAEGSLREGLLYDQMGRFTQGDVRDRTTDALVASYQIDIEQADRVGQVAHHIFEQVKNSWQLDKERHLDLLKRAAKLHEIGLFISHTQFHKHGAYILRHADLAGFSHQDQTALALIVRTHRRKFPKQVFEELPKSWQKAVCYLAVILRLAVLLCHGRNTVYTDFQIQTSRQTLQLTFPDRWLSNHPLAQTELTAETAYLNRAGFELVAK